ncbi:MAG TPA: hypothetical protein VM165_14795 [Planctomycetaceae bacterium]|nr:hypothetical protein [Planctomycetaceae bacterium]
MSDPHSLSRIQRFFLALFPKSWGESMERDSREWQVICPCGCKRSIWELGGIRWKTTGNPRTWMRCPTCGERRWHKIIKEAAAPVPPAHG